jgi:hypothetical protein
VNQRRMPHARPQATLTPDEMIWAALRDPRYWFAAMTGLAATWLALVLILGAQP